MAPALSLRRQRPGGQSLLGDRARRRHGVHLQGVRQRRGVGGRASAGTGRRRTRLWSKRAGATTIASGRTPTRPRPPRRSRSRPSATSAWGSNGRHLNRRQQEIADALRLAVDADRRPPGPDDGRQHLRGPKAARDSRRGDRRRRRRLVFHLLPAVPLRHQPDSGLPVDRQSRCGRVRGMRRPRAGGRQLLSLRADFRRRSGRPRLVRARAFSIACGTARTSSSSASTPPRKASSGDTASSSSRSTGSSSKHRSRRTAGEARCGAFRSPTIRHTAPGRSTTTRRRWRG